ncbi:mechanosensitive ion channel family protein [Campylobacter rectus]|uniref:mechanosensitive ion channel family protein n=1 Tax=Campylobacter rectus TaxID=203 RepID=UPI0028E1DEEC|nr:mechanosensitive ion channel family protein [Campylobacter rectus]
MRKILAAVFALCFSLNLLANTASDDLNATDILSVVNQINEANAQIAVIKAQSAENNETADKSVLFKTVLDKKEKLIEQIPYLIMQIEIDEEQVRKFEQEMQTLSAKTKKLKNQGNQNLYVKNMLELERMRLDGLFYSSLLNLENIFKEGGKAVSVKLAVEEALLSFQTEFYAQLKEFRESLDENLIAEHKGEFDALEAHKKTLEEILHYLRDNAELLTSNYIISELNLKTAIDFINEKASFTSKFNVGKAAIIFVVFLFFVSFTTLLSKLTLWALMKFFVKHDSDRQTKGRIVEIIKRPMLLTLIAYAIDICVSIAYYPAPMPIKFANFLTITFVVAVTWLVLSVLNGYGMVLINELTKKSGRKEVINLILKIIYFIIFVIALLIVLSKLGFNVSAIIASLGIGGLAVALATKDILANFFASVMLLFDNSFSQGDWIVCGDIEGTVVEIGLRKTTVRTFDNALIFVPNSKLASDPIRNWSRRKMGRRIRMLIGLEYSATTEQIKKCVDEIKQMLIDHPGIAKGDDMGSKKASRYDRGIVSIDDLAGYKSNLFVVVDEFADSSINILVYCFSKTIVWGEFLAIKEDVMLKIMNIVEANGLGFAFPSQSLYVEEVKK